MKFGDIYTNGINYWMVVYAGKPSCECCKSGGLAPSIVSVVLKDGKPDYTVGYTKTEDPRLIPPTCWLYSRMEFNKVS